MNKKFGLLRFIGTVYKVFGIILAVIAVIAAAAVCITTFAGGAALNDLSREFGMGSMMGIGGALGGIIGGITILIGLGLAAISQYAIGEAIFLFLAIEENTRATAVMLQRQSEG